MYIRHLKDTVYQRTIVFVFGYETEELRQYIKKTKNPEHDPIDGECSGQVMTFEKGSLREHWICVHGKDLAKVRMEVIAHECLHLVFAIMEYVGVKPHDASEEAYAYYLESVFKQCLSILNTQYHKQKKYDGAKTVQHDAGND